MYEHRINKDAPFIGMAVELCVKVRPTGIPRRVDKILGHKARFDIRDLGRETAKIQGNADRTSYAKPRKSNQASIPRIGDNAETGMQNPGKLKQSFSVSVSNTMSTFLISTVLSLFNWIVPSSR